ncbi:MAG: hypothetical protein ACREUQ_09275, partial [Burkholderiales bacterium]
MPRLKPRRNTTPFDVTLTPAARAILTDEWCTAIDDALDARASMIADGGTIDYLDWFYEQGKSAAKDLPFPGAADLPSYIITENVDTMHAQLLQAVFGVKPFAFVEGWGSSATRAPVVEAFIDWKVRKGTLRAVLDQAVLGALLEDCYILEVRERLETRRIVETIDVALVTSPQGGAIFGADGTPQMQMGEDGEPVRAQPGEPAVTIERSSIKTKHLGPGYDAISMKDFVYLPGHARTMEQVWGYAYRFWDRLPTIQEKGDDRLYDRAAILELGEQSDREEYSVPRPVDAIPAAQGAAAEKELWQLSIKRDLDEDGREEWYVATLSRKHRTMLRLKLDTFVMQVGRPRCVPIVLFPRRNSVYGYSYAGDKLLTLAEEHTSLRNMKADRGALATNAPFKIRTGALWNPDTQPIGIGRGIPVRSMDEIEMLQIPDVPNSIVEQERAILQAKERVGMLADAAVGVLSTERRTLGENRLVSGGSSVRVRAIIGRLHEAIAAILELTLAHWVEALKADAHGLDAPLAVQQALEGRGMGLPDGRFTADQLTGEFSFEPYGSVESADPQRRQQNFNGGMTALANLAQVFPGLLPVLQNPEAAKAVLEEWLRVHDVRDREPFLQAFAQPMAMPPGLVSGA